MCPMVWDNRDLNIANTSQISPLQRTGDPSPPKKNQPTTAMVNPGPSDHIREMYTLVTLKAFLKKDNGSQFSSSALRVQTGVSTLHPASRLGPPLP